MIQLDSNHLCTLNGISNFDPSKYIWYASTDYHATKSTLRLWVFSRRSFKIPRVYTLQCWQSLDYLRLQLTFILIEVADDFDTLRLRELLESTGPMQYIMLFQVTLALANTPWTLLDNLISLESLADIRERVLSDKLNLNDDKTAFTIIGTRKQLSKINIDFASRRQYNCTG